MTTDNRLEQLEKLLRQVLQELGDMSPRFRRCAVIWSSASSDWKVALIWPRRRFSLLKCACPR